MIRRVGEPRAEAERRHARQANSKGILRGIGWAIMWLMSRMGQFFFYAVGVYEIFSNSNYQIGVLLIICGLLLRLCLFVARAAQLIIAANFESMIRITDPEAANDEMQPPKTL